MEPISATAAIMGGLQLGSSIFGGISGRKSAKKAAAALAQLRADVENKWNKDVAPEYQPYIDYGSSSVGNLQKLEGGDYSAFENSPDYLFAKQEGQRAMDRSALASGILGTGYGRQLQRYGQGLASQQLGAYRQAQQFGASEGANAVNSKQSLYANSYLPVFTGTTTGQIQQQANARMAIPNSISQGISGAAQTMGFFGGGGGGNMFTQGGLQNLYSRQGTRGVNNFNNWMSGMGM